MSQQPRAPLPDSWRHPERLAGTYAIPVSLIRKRLDLSCSMARCHLPGDDVVRLVPPLHGHLTRLLLVMGDRLRGHKQAARLLPDRSGTRNTGSVCPPLCLLTTPTCARAARARGAHAGPVTGARPRRGLAPLGASATLRCGVQRGRTRLASASGGMRYTGQSTPQRNAP